MTSTCSPDDFEDRPRLRLLELLERRQINFADFALACEMASVPERWSSGKSREEEHRDRARVALRKYTHGVPDASGGRSYRRPGPDLICRWAAQLGVDPGYFWSTGRPKKRRIGRRRARA